jgi:prevent-host-death family protein
VADTVGLRELRQHASELVRRVEAGDEILVTVAGRPTARLVPVRRRRWRRGSEIARIFEAATDPAWASEHAVGSDGLDDVPRDPWARQE